MHAKAALCNSAGKIPWILEGEPGYARGMIRLPRMRTWWSDRIISMRRDKRRTMITGFAYLLAIAWLDYVTGYAINPTVLYITPLIMLTVAGGWRAGMVMAFLCALSIEGTDWLAGQRFEHPVYHVYSLLSHFLSYLSFLFLIVQLLKLYDAEKDMAGRDSLTGLRNRYGFLAYAEESLRDLARRRTTAVLAVWNLAKLREVNARFGHDKADALLVSVADALAEAVPEAVGARLTADRFALLAQAPDEASRGRLLASLEAAIVSAAEEVGVPLNLRSAWAAMPPLHRTPEELAGKLDELIDSVK